MGEMRQLSPDTVIISSNENPLGPAQSALSAICTTASLGGRYHFDETMKTLTVFNEQFGLKRGYSALFPGSGGPLDLALMSNIGPDKPLVYADPSYEQGPRAADTMKAPKFAVPLTATYAHDVKAMLKAHPSPGAYYIVNPNNPTGTMTPKEDIVHRRSVSPLLERRLLHRPGGPGQGRDRDADVLEDLRHGRSAGGLCGGETGPAAEVPHRGRAEP